MKNSIIICSTTISSGNLNNLADGRRVRTIHKTYNTGLSYLLDNVQKFNDPVFTTEEVREGDLILKDGLIARLEIPGGYINMREPQFDKLAYYYYVHDYLGSVRATVSADSLKAVQQIEYTPTGSIWRTRDLRALQPRHICGKEKLTVNGYGMYESGARFHTNNCLRFISQDKLAEKYPAISPYVYCAANPVMLIDPDGRRTWQINEQGEIVGFSDKNKNFDAIVIVDLDGGTKTDANGTFMIFENRQRG